MPDHLIIPTFMGVIGTCVVPQLLLRLRRTTVWYIIGIGSVVIGATQFWLLLSVFPVGEALLRSVVTALIPGPFGYLMYLVLRRAKR